ncbi:MAG TPA: outer membrane beta-barrel protein [Gemmatimonadaceae bacterium]
MNVPRSFRLVIALAIAIAVAIPAGTVSAQVSGNGYLFHAPYVTFNVRGGYASATAGSDVFNDVTRQLTLNKRDFGSLTIGGDVGFSITSRLDLTLDAAYSRSSHKSEFRDFVDNNNLPIEQTTTFERVPLTANLKLRLASPGRAIGRLAWIPSRVVPYVGAGVGVMSYRFRQQGDFVDFNTNAVFPSTVDTQEDGKDWAFIQQAMAGVEYNFSPMFGVTLDARYLHGRGDLGTAFTGYDKIDLSGASASVGLSMRL